MRFSIDVGRLENNPRISDCPDGPTELAACRHLRNILRAKGYEVFYTEHNGSHALLC